MASLNPVAHEHAGISRCRKREVDNECRDEPLEDDDEDKDDKSRTSERNRRLSAALRPFSSVAAKTRARWGRGVAARTGRKIGARDTARSSERRLYLLLNNQTVTTQPVT